MDTCSEIQSHRDSLRVNQVVQVDLLGLVDPALMDQSIKRYQNLRKPQSSKKVRTKNGFDRSFGTSIALHQSAALAVSIQQSRFS
jgi:predicted RNA-binding protein with RPS1 domain